MKSTIGFNKVEEYIEIYKIENDDENVVRGQHIQVVHVVEEVILFIQL
jgi:hypothetical protein